MSNDFLLEQKRRQFMEERLKRSADYKIALTKQVDEICNRIRAEAQRPCLPPVFDIDSLDPRKQHERDHAAQGSHYSASGWGRGD